jgi:hypothetical protein
MGTELSTSGGLTDSQKAKAKQLGLTNTEFYNRLLNKTVKETAKLKPKPAAKKKETKSRFLKKRF